jgi:hypothetical protein
MMLDPMGRAFAWAAALLSFLAGGGLKCDAPGPLDGSEPARGILRQALEIYRQG